MNCCRGKRDDVVEQLDTKPTPATIQDLDQCKCSFFTDENGNVLNKTCVRKHLSEGKLVLKNCCDPEKFNEIVDKNNNVKCMKKPPPLPKIVVKSQSERLSKGKQVTTKNVSKKLV